MNAKGIVALALAASVTAIGAPEERSIARREVPNVRTRILLKVEDGESSIEEAIAGHLGEEGLKVISWPLGEDEKDMVLILLFENEVEGGPPFSCLWIDTMALKTDPLTGKVVCRGVFLTLPTQLYIEPRLRSMALEALNERNGTEWKGTFFIAWDGELILQRVLPITEEGLSAQNVSFMLEELLLGWQELYPVAKRFITEKQPGDLGRSPESKGMAEFPFASEGEGGKHRKVKDAIRTLLDGIRT